MHQLRQNLKVLDTLADDASGDDSDGYVNIEEPPSDNEEDGSSEDDDANVGLFGRIKEKFGM